MPIPSIDVDDGLSALLAGDLDVLNTQPVEPGTPAPISFGEQVMGAIQALIQRTNGENPLPREAVSNVLYEVDLSGLANNTFADGSESIDGITWTEVNRANANVHDIANGSGLRYSSPTSSAGTFLSGSQTSAYIYTTLGAVLTAAGQTFDNAATYVIDCYFSTLVRENGETPVVGFWNSTDSILRAGALRLATGPVYNVGSVTTSASYSTVDVGSTHNAISVAVTPTGATVVASGAYSAGWPAFDNGIIVAPATGQVTFARSNTRIVFSAIQASDASPTFSYVMARWRLRRA